MVMSKEQKLLKAFKQGCTRRTSLDLVYKLQTRMVLWYFTEMLGYHLDILEYSVSVLFQNMEVAITFLKNVHQKLHVFSPYFDDQHHHRMVFTRLMFLTGQYSIKFQLIFRMKLHGQRKVITQPQKWHAPNSADVF